MFVLFCYVIRDLAMDRSRSRTKYPKGVVFQKVNSELKEVKGLIHDSFRSLEQASGHIN